VTVNRSSCCIYTGN